MNTPKEHTTDAVFATILYNVDLIKCLHLLPENTFFPSYYLISAFCPEQAESLMLLRRTSTLGGACTLTFLNKTVFICIIVI